MSTLAQQLGVLQSSSLNAQRLLSTTSRAQPSYLFEPKRAAELSLADVHALGHNGLLALAQSHPSLAALEPTLFSERAKQTDRTTLSRGQNDELDGTIKAALDALAPHILSRPCGQVLEWLVRRFRCVGAADGTDDAASRTSTSARRLRSSCHITRRRNSSRCCSC